jgi:hypothetical protein
VRAGLTHILLFLFLLFNTSFVHSQSKRSGHGTRINFGPVVGFYTINQKHAIQPSQKPSIMAGFRREYRVDRNYQLYLQAGIDYFLHGLNFRSYYFAPDSIKLYDKSFRYTYSLFLHELNLPVQMKYLFKREDNSLFSPYVTLAYHLRYMIQGNLKVTESGNQVKKDAPEIRFRNPLLSDRMNAFVSVGIGWQKNYVMASRGSFFAELNYRYGFSAYYFEKDYAATSLFINGTHLSLQLGMKF